MIAETAAPNTIRGAQARPHPLRRALSMAQSMLNSEVENDAVAIDGKRVRLPQWVVLMLFTVLSGIIGGAYFMGSLAADVRHERELRADDLRRAEGDRREMADRIELYRLKMDGAAKEIAELKGRLEGRRKGD